MDKETLHIFYDSSNDQIKVMMYSKDGSYLSSSAWQDVLISLMDNNNFKRACSKDDLIVEYPDIIVKVDNWKNCSKSPIVSRYIMKSIAKQQQNRIQAVKRHNATIMAKKQNVDKVGDTELIPDFISKALNERHDKAFNEAVRQELLKKEQITNNRSNSLKVTRKNKYNLFTPIITGTLVLGILAGNAIFKEDKVVIKDQEFNNNNIISSPVIETLVSQETADNDNFQIGLDINDLVQANGLSTDYSSEVSLKYEDRSKDDKVIETKIKYGDLIEKYAKKCGIAPRIVLGIATQESGDHELGLRSGSKGGLMQIEVSYWDGKEVTYYDFDDKESYVIKIDENINDVENNILIGCAILQNELKTYNYNILLAIQSYNMGYSNTSKILDAASAESGLTKTAIINDEKYLDWLKYTDIVNQGDPNYVNNVLSWTGFGYSFYELSCQKESGDVKVCTTLPMEPINIKAI